MNSLPDIRGRVIALDTESTGIEFWKHSAFGVAIAFRENGKPQFNKYDQLIRPEEGEIRAFYIDIRRPENLQWLRDQLPQVKLWINHYIKYDAHMLREAEVNYDSRKLACTMIREAIIEENKYEYGLEDLSWKYLGYGKKEPWARLAELFGGKADRETQITNLQFAPEELVAEYAMVDAVNALLIFEAQQPQMTKQELEDVYWKVEMPLLRVVLDMERGGVRTDQERALKAHRLLSGEIRQHQAALDRIAGRKGFNANSAPQVKEILGVHQGADGNWYTSDGMKCEKTKPSVSFPDGQASVPSLLLQSSPHPAAEHIVQIRGMMKARDTMLGTYVLKMHHNGYVHASINQTRTEDGNGVYTGRFSITDPALQQIHKRNKKMAAIVRSCFIPDEWADNWDCIDWSQVDFRVFAHFLNDKRINGMYAADPSTDFHRLTSELTGLPRDRDEKTGGANAKQINLACVFGMGAGKLAQQCRLPYSINARGYYEAGPEAKRLFAKYHNNIPGVRKLSQQVESVATTREFIRTMLGRRIRFPGGHNAHKAAGLLYQGTAADMMKVKLIEVYEYIQSLPAFMVRLALTVHDEFDLMSTREAHERGYLHEIKRIVETFDGVRWPIKLRIPIRGDWGHGPNWWEASK